MRERKVPGPVSSWFPDPMPALLRARKRAEELRTELEAARRQGDQERLARLRAQLRARRKELKSPHAPIEEMRKLLSEAQRRTFDMNRARLIAEGQKARQAQQGVRAKRRGAGGPLGAPLEAE